MGIFQVPIDIGSEILIFQALKYSTDFEKIYLVCYKEQEYNRYCAVLDDMLKGKQ